MKGLALINYFDLTAYSRVPQQSTLPGAPASIIVKGNNFGSETKRNVIIFTVLNYQARIFQLRQMRRENDLECWVGGDCMRKGVQYLEKVFQVSPKT
jgi:hypothetical protein